MLQVIQLASWLTSNAQLLMEVGGQHADGSNGDLKIQASRASLGFHSDQVRLRFTHMQLKCWMQKDPQKSGNLYNN